MTSPTSEFGRMHWRDTLRFSEKDGSIPPFSEEQLELAEDYIKVVEPGKVFMVGKSRFKIRPVNAGHILGAAGYLIETGSKRIFATGDYSLYTYPLVESFDFSPFAKEGVDGDAQKGFEIYNEYTNGILSDARRRFVGNNNVDRRGRFKRIFSRREILGHKPSIIIASSGMMFEHSVSHWYASELIGKKDAAILLVGYQDPESPGALLQNASAESKIFWGGKELTLRAAVNSYAFTAHAREYELVELIIRLRPRVTVFAHGESEYIERFLQKYRTILPSHKIIAKNGEAIKI